MNVRHVPFKAFVLLNRRDFDTKSNSPFLGTKILFFKIALATNYLCDYRQQQVMRCTNPIIVRIVFSIAFPRRLTLREENSDDKIVLFTESYVNFSSHIFCDANAARNEERKKH